MSYSPGTDITEYDDLTRREMAVESRAEDQQRDRDWDGFETARAQDRYLNHLLGVA